MPQQRQEQSLKVHRIGKSFQIAQAEGEKKPGQTGMSAETKEEPIPIGAIPDPYLLFYNSVLIAVIILAFAFFAAKSRQQTPKGFPNFAEFVAEGLDNFTKSIVGPKGSKYTPLVGTIFIYVLMMNFIGHIPGLHSPSANLSITLALGLTVFIYVQYENIRQNTLIGYLKHLCGPMPALSPLLFVVELISECIRPLTLAIRLFGNIFGEEVIVVVFASLLTILNLPALGFLPVQFPILVLSVITGVVQAMVFSMLTGIYLLLALPHDKGHEHDLNEEEAVAHQPANVAAH